MILALLSAGLTIAQEQTVTAAVEEASLFKNGLAVVFRSIVVPSSGEYLLEKIPDASLGTLWFATDGGARLREVVATTQERTIKSPIASLDQLLMANVGKQVRLGILNGDEVTRKQISGKLVSAAGQVVLIDTGNETVAIQKPMITSVAASTGTLSTNAATTTPTRGLRFRVEGAGRILMVSLEKGLTWAPNYAVDITDPKTLKLTAKSTILNDLEDLKDIEARFVTGFPNLPYAFAPDPLTSAPSVAAFVNTLGQIGGPGAPGGFGGGGMGGQGIMTQNAAGRITERMDLGASMPSTGIGGSQEEDLFFYRQPNVSLKLGDRSYMILFEAKADYRHLYTWDISDTVQNDIEYRGTDPNVPQEFWHAVLFKNTAGQPLTTAVATTFKKGEILGQDILKYTPAGAEAEVRITKALDIRAEASEEEVDRKRQALQLPQRPIYDLVTLKGTLVIQNTKREKVDIKVTKELTGELISSEGDPKTTKLAKRLMAINPRMRLEWSKQLEPGQSLTLTYSYQVYVQS